MKKIKLARLTIVGFLALVAFSCSEQPEAPIDTLDEIDETLQETDLTGTMEDIDEITLTGFQRNEFAGRILVETEDDICDRANITWLPEEKKMIIDFGEGCTSPRGVFRKGKIIVSFTGRFWIPGTIITTTFENFFINDMQIEGIRVVKNLGFNAEESYFSFSTVVEGGKITWSDGTSKTFEARHTKRIYLPNGERGLFYAVSGGSAGTNRNGNSYVSEIVEPLIFIQRCIQTGVNIPSAGILSLKISGRQEILVDFGDRTCDREVTLTIGDQTKTIILSRN
ncbi:hypothetical protein [Algoriphagus sp. CAU 1675]|uniref:hypothetical protein n=1 Tax=Algoriphagus sp. CAU 1675 TaxID=3032597 RepID=UPI0023D9D127|nr:hypothetical protein [Algoriphagus sp. CAU 1675]MDF2156228.1 hypothetical protein [Algoriphagus sp. CAU 1675]